MQRDRNLTDRMVKDKITVSRIGKDISALISFRGKYVEPVNGLTMDETIDRTRMAVVGAHFRGYVVPTYDHVNINLKGLSASEGSYFAKGMSTVYKGFSLKGGSQ